MDMVPSVLNARYGAKVQTFTDGKGFRMIGTWKASPDTDARGAKGFRIDSDKVSLIAWVPDGEGAESAEETAELIALAVNQYAKLSSAHAALVKTLADANEWLQSMVKNKNTDDEGRELLLRMPKVLRAATGDEPSLSDYENALRRNDWQQHADGDWYKPVLGTDGTKWPWYDTAKEACEKEGIEP